jgi:poly(A) polymerase
MVFTLPAHIDAVPSTRGIYIVGGSVRDILLERQPTDCDIVVSKNPELFASEMAKNLSRRVIKLGKPGHLLYRIVSKNIAFDISPLYAPTIHENLSSRDFTINAIAYSLEENRFIDPENGIRDLKNRIIRMITQKALKQDPVRLLRAFRIASELDFTIEPDTIKAIKDTAPHLMVSAGERIRSELMKLLSSSSSSRHVRQMARTGLLFALFHGFKDVAGCFQNNHHDFDVLEHTLNAYNHLEQIIHGLWDYFPGCGSDLSYHLDDTGKALLKLSILLHDMGKPAAKSVEPDGAIHFIGHASKSAKMAAAAGGMIKLSNDEMDYLDTVIRQHNRPLHLFQLNQKHQLTPKAVTTFFLSAGDRTPDILIHSIADHLGKKKEPDGRFVEFARDLIRIYFKKHLKKLQNKPLVTGYDLINTFGLTPSPIFSKILKQIEIRQMSGLLQTRTEAVAWVTDFLNARLNSNS